MNTRKRLNSLHEEIQRKINEDLDRRLVNSAIDLITKLKSINFDGLDSLQRARDEIVTDAVQIASGDRTVGQRIANFFGSKTNPLMDGMAFASSIRNFFPLLHKLIVAVVDDDQMDSPLSDIAEANPKLEAMLQKVVTNGLKPTNQRLLKSDWMKRYIQDPTSITSEVMSLSPNELSSIADTVKSVTQTVNATVEKAETETETSSENPDKRNQIKSLYSDIKGELGDLSNDQKQTVYKVLSAIVNQRAR